MEQIFLVGGLPKETLTAIMMFYKNPKVKIHSPDGNTDFFDIVSPISVYNLPRLYTSNVDRSNERKWIYSEKGKNQMVSMSM